MKTYLFTDKNDATATMEIAAPDGIAAWVYFGRALRREIGQGRARDPFSDLPWLTARFTRTTTTSRPR